MKKKFVTEDEALGRGVSLDSLVKEQEEQGYVLRNEFTHEAVGKVKVMYHKEWLKDIEAKLKRNHGGALIRDVTIDGADNIHYIVVNKDDTWMRKSCGGDI